MTLVYTDGATVSLQVLPSEHAAFLVFLDEMGFMPFSDKVDEILICAPWTPKHQEKWNQRRQGPRPSGDRRNAD